MGHESRVLILRDARAGGRGAVDSEKDPEDEGDEERGLGYNDVLSGSALLAPY